MVTVSKFFLSKSGAKSGRIAGKPGQGHYDLAKETLDKLGVPVTPGTDVYDQMARFGFVRVVQIPDDLKLMVDAPRPLSKAQRDFIRTKQAEGYAVEINGREFVESRQQAPAALVARLLA
jgi:hypothetical protein